MSNKSIQDDCRYYYSGEFWIPCYPYFLNKLRSLQFCIELIPKPIPDKSYCAYPFGQFYIEVDLALTLQGVATTPKLIDYSYFFISSVISKSSSILFLFLFCFCSSFLCNFSFLIGVLEFEIFSSLFSMWNEAFQFLLTLPAASYGGSTSRSCSASLSPNISSMLHLAYLISFWLLASQTASSKICYLCESKAG